MTAPQCDRCGLDRACSCFKPMACMGGGCAKRGACQHYHAEDRSEPVERLCERGRDGVLADATAATINPAPARAFAAAKAGVL